MTNKLIYGRYEKKCDKKEPPSQGKRKTIKLIQTN
jgi:hypothetical protein